MENKITKCSIRAELIRNKTHLVEMVSVPPAKFIAPESHASGALCFISNYGGGMLGGDNVTIDIEVAENSGLVLLPQANSRAYTDTEGKAAVQHMDIVVRKNGRFVFNADPLVLHANSKYIQQTDLLIEDNAGAVLVDWFSIGRSENGERFLFSEYASSLRVRNADAVFLIDRQNFTPDTFMYNIAGSFADYTQMLNVFFLGEYTVLGRELQEKKAVSGSDDYIYSFTHNENYTILRVLGKKRKSLQVLLRQLYSQLKNDALIGFDALERKM